MSMPRQICLLCVLLLFASTGHCLFLPAMKSTTSIPSTSSLHRAMRFSGGRSTKKQTRSNSFSLASSVVLADIDAESARIERRSWRVSKRNEVIKFAIPSLSGVLADPLMSVVDALCVGRFCNTIQLASLGPALAVFNFVNYFFFFLNAATCVLMTQCLAVGDKERAQEVLSNALTLALGFGITLGTLVICYADPLIALTGCVPELIATASSYLKVRAIGQPVVLAAMVIQSGLMAQLDTVTPLQVILSACFFNIIGDLLLVPTMGATGAAWATLLSQIAVFPLLLYLNKIRRRIAIKVRKPRLPEMQKFYNTAAPLFFFEAGMSTCYLLIESLSTQFGVLSAGAFRALWSPLSVLCFFTYPLKQAAQVFLPAILSEEGSKQYVGNQPKIKEFLKVLATLSTWCGVVLSIIAVLLSQQPQLFTKDPVLWPIMMSFKEYVGVLLPVLGIAQVLEGVLIGTDDLSFLSYSQIGNVILSFAALYVTKSMKMGVHGTWVVFMSFLLSRAIQASIRVFNTKKPWKTIKKA